MLFNTFRFDYETEEQKIKALEYIKNNFMKYCIADEIADKTKKLHLQGKVLLKKSIETERRNMKKQLPFLNTSNYSFAKIKDKDEYDSYICKSGNLPLNNCFDEKFVLDAVEKHRILKEAFDEKTKLKKIRDKQLTFTQELTRDFQKDHPNLCENLINYSYSHDEELIYETKMNLLKYILKRLGSLSKVFDKIILQRLYNGVKFGILKDNDKVLKRATKFFAEELVL